MAAGTLYILSRSLERLHLLSQRRQCMEMAARAGFEPATLRVTAAGATAAPPSYKMEEGTGLEPVGVFRPRGVSTPVQYADLCQPSIKMGTYDVWDSNPRAVASGFPRCFKPLNQRHRRHKIHGIGIFRSRLESIQLSVNKEPAADCSAAGSGLRRDVLQE